MSDLRSLAVASAAMSSLETGNPGQFSPKF